MKSFKTAAKSKAAIKKRRANPVEFELDGRVMKAYPPKDAAYVMLAASADEGSGMSAAIEMTRFLEGILDKEDADHLTARLRDPEDAFDLGDLGDIFNHLLSELTGRPTESQSA